VKGRAPNGAAVEILDADTNAWIATGETERNGRFRLYVTVQAAPCALIAKANGLTSIRTPVAGAPASCGNVKPPRNDDEDDEKEDKRKSGSKENHARDGKSLLKQNRQDR
jgi:hypothetical protein